MSDKKSPQHIQLPAAYEPPSKRVFTAASARAIKVPSLHQMLSDAAAIVGNELQRLRIKSEGDGLEAKDVDSFQKLVKSVESIDTQLKLNESRVLPSVGVSPDQLSDTQLLALLQNAGGIPRSLGAGANNPTQNETKATAPEGQRVWNDVGAVASAHSGSAGAQPSAYSENPGNRDNQVSRYPHASTSTPGVYAGVRPPTPPSPLDGAPVVAPEAPSLMESNFGLTPRVKPPGSNK